MKQNQKYWQSLEELEQNSGFLQKQENEFSEELPVGANDHLSPTNLPLSRRDFLKAFGFSTAAVMSACSRMSVEKAIPYVVQPEEIVPGKAFWYASTCGGCSAGCGTLIKTREGRPIKIEGNPDSLVNRGGLCAVGQAQVLSLYDSSRLQGPFVSGSKTTWSALDQKFLEDLKSVQEKKGAIRILTKSLLSPSTKKILKDFIAKNPNAKHITYDAVSVSGLIEAHRQAFGKQTLPHFSFNKADLIVSFGADFLGTWISPVEFAKQYSEKRKLSAQNPNMSEHIQFESAMTLTGANADRRFPIKPSEEGVLLLHLLNAIAEALGKTLIAHLPEIGKAQDILLVSKKLLQARGRSLVVSGSNDTATQLTVAKINDLLQNYGKTIDINQVSYQKQGLDQGFETLVSEMEQGGVEALILFDVNPVYQVGTRFLEAMKRVPVTLAVCERLDETAKHVKYVAPRHHGLESWNDAEPVKGFYQLRQPAIAPVYDTREAGESFLKWFGDGGSYLNFVKVFWQNEIYPKQKSLLGFENFWKQSLQKGVVTLPYAVSSASVFSGDIAEAAKSVLKQYHATEEGLELVLLESVALRDGAHANNPWLQELPDPITKIVWDNHISISVKQATTLGLEQGDVVVVDVKGKQVHLPVFLQPGQAEGTIAIALGYGRTDSGKVGNGVGQNVFPFVLEKNGRCYFRSGVKIVKTDQRHTFAQTQTSLSAHDRPILKETTLAQFQNNPAAGNEDLETIKESLSKRPTDRKDMMGLAMLWKAHEENGHSWGLAIDLNSCIGCSGCLIGCQSENNVPVVGKEEVGRRREMHWIRIDRYYKGETTDNPEIAFQPMLCQHCGSAPCESVCPVAATVHSQDGLNQQVYNRCVGTRYCANNCPYKVRRFNWFNYAKTDRFDYYMNDDVGRLVLNPDVTVRSRGVMEKCTMCVQRIQDEKHKARAEGRTADADKIQTACQQSCPTDAIVFGDLNDENGSLAKLLKTQQHRRYNVLAELNTRPAVNYLTKVRNKA